MRFTLPSIVAILALTLPGQARAQDEQGDPFVSPPPDLGGGEVTGAAAQRRSRIGLDLTFMFKEVDTGLTGTLKLTSLSPIFRGFFTVAPHGAIGVDWGFISWTHASGGGDSEDGVFPGNPFVGGYYLQHLVDDLHLDVGGGLGLPLSAASDDDLGSAAGVFALATQGLYDAWLYLENTMSVVLEADLHGSLAQGVYLGAELALPIFIVVKDLDDDADRAELGIQFALEVGFDSGVVIPGLRFQGVWIPTSGGDNFQAALAPFVRIELPGGYFHAMLLMNLDDPLGFAFDEEGFYGVTVGGGVNL